MNLFSDWDDTSDEEGSMFSHWLEDDSPKSAYKDDGDMKLFKDEDE
jgi:hypothetical protein